MTETLVVRLQVKKILGELNLSGDYMAEINKQVRDIVLKSIERAKANNRRTVMARDI